MVQRAICRWRRAINVAESTYLEDPTAALHPRLVLDPPEIDIYEERLPVHRVVHVGHFHKQNWDEGRFRLQGTWDVHRPRDFEEYMHWVVDFP
jgi:hypothetical protein